MQPFVPTICASCAELLVSPAITQPHQHMKVRSRQTSRKGDGDGEYICLECESLWKLSFSESALDGAKLIDHKGIRIVDGLANCPSRYRCSENLATCPILKSAPRH